MEALILAAGAGTRLASVHTGPKILLDFGGRTLLARHLTNLQRLGVARVTLCLGHAASEVMSATESLEDKPEVRYVRNEAYREGSIRSLWAARDSLRGTDDLLLMDADVLYAPALLERLVVSAHGNCLLLDRSFEPGEEPVKVRLQKGRIVEFSKRPDPRVAFDTEGESVGFFRLQGSALEAMWTLAEAFVARGDAHLPHEDALRELFLRGDCRVGVEDITGVSWMEIDFPEDLERARREILAGADSE